MADKTTFAMRLRYVLADHDITAAMLSARTGIQPPNMSRLLHDYRDPTLRTLQKVVRELPASVNIRELIIGKES